MTQGDVNDLRVGDLIRMVGDRNGARAALFLGWTDVSKRMGYKNVPSWKIAEILGPRGAFQLRRKDLLELFVRVNA